VDHINPLIDAVRYRPLRPVRDQLPVSEAVKTALLEGKNPRGQLPGLAICGRAAG
jgi:hypothetical protein